MCVNLDFTVSFVKDACVYLQKSVMGNVSVQAWMPEGKTEALLLKSSLFINLPIAINLLNGLSLICDRPALLHHLV